MASRFTRRAFARWAAANAPPALVPPPLPGSVVDAVLRYHDQIEDQGAGRSLLRLSSRRLHDAEVEAALGDLAPRAAGVSILWNERESEIIRVLENRLAA